MSGYSSEDEPLVSIAKALHRIADGLHAITDALSSDAPWHVEIDTAHLTIEPSDAESLRVRIEKDED